MSDSFSSARRFLGWEKECGYNYFIISTYLAIWLTCLCQKTSGGAGAGGGENLEFLLCAKLSGTLYFFYKIVTMIPIYR